MTEIKIGSHSLAVYNLHLESRADNRLRMLRLSETVKDARKYFDSYSVLFAGDLNLDLGRSYFPAKELEREGFHSAITLPAAYTTTLRGILAHRRTMGWVYLAGPVESISSGVLELKLTAV